MLGFARGGFLIRPPGDRLVLVDAGIGARSGEMMSGNGHFHGGELLNSLGALGVRADDITDVVFTHLHFDHVGWASHNGQSHFRMPPTAATRATGSISETTSGCNRSWHQSRIAWRRGTPAVRWLPEWTL